MSDSSRTSAFDRGAGAAGDLGSRVRVFAASALAGSRRGPDSGRPKPAAGAVSTAALSTAVRYIVGALPGPGGTSDGAEAVETLKGSQDRVSGAFAEPGRETPGARVDMPLFGWAIRALNMLGARPTHPVKFLARWDSPEELTWWLGLLDWDRSAGAESMRVMNVAVPRAVALRAGQERHGASLDALMKWLAGRQDPATGLWMASPGVDLGEAMGATFHAAVIHEAAGVPVPAADRIAATVLDMWREGAGWGGSWQAMAALSVLERCLRSAPTETGGRERARELALAEAGRALAEGARQPLGDVVTRLELLRAAGALLALPAPPKAAGDLGPAHSWQSAWSPGLWACEW